MFASSKAAIGERFLSEDQRNRQQDRRRKGKKTEPEPHASPDRSLGRSFQQGKTPTLELVVLPDAPPIAV